MPMKTYTSTNLLEIVSEIADKKRFHIRRSYPELDHLPLLTADTIVAIGDTVLMKPQNREEAKAMLRRLSGSVHKVISGICFEYGDAAKKIQLEAVTEVNFDHISEKTMEWYLNSNEWMDAAGAYKIQEKGGALVKAIDGCYWNVVGLPMNEIFCIVQDAGLIR
jgi:septum formation protein